MPMAYFEPDLFRFLKELKRNNRKDWFEKRKPRYELAVKRPLLRFIADFDVRIRTVSKHFHADARPSGGSMFRIYRDTRFSSPPTSWIATSRPVAARAHWCDSW